MSSGKWSDRFIIGLTGNIGTGKSLVRRMLQALGAYGIDGDLLAYQAALPGSIGYTQIIAAFGQEILCTDGSIDRKKLARIVFDNSSLLTRLEGIIHPIVLADIDRLLRENPSPVNVIEAIKLLETDLGWQCDSIWVTTSSPETQFLRLTGDRGLSPEAARQRISVQNDADLKIKAAQVVLSNDGAIADLWKQVADAWNSVLSDQISAGAVDPAPEFMPADLVPALSK
ncbi:MAG: dephospho-CoA kinase [Anaerolineaceae bacterium]